MKIKYIVILASVLLVGPAFSMSGKDRHKSGHQKHQMDGTQEFDRGMKPILDNYLKVYEAILKGDVSNLKEYSEKIDMHSKKLDPNSVKGEHAGHYQHVPMNLSKSAVQLKSAKNIKEAREALKSLSKPLAMWVSMSKPSGYAVKYCPMVKASWIQKEGKTRNPYDEKMPGCGIDV